MTVKELKQKLDQFPENMEVFIAERKTEFAYGLLSSVRTQEITFSEDPYPDPEDEPRATDTVVVLDEE